MILIITCIEPIAGTVNMKGDAGKKVNPEMKRDIRAETA